MLAKTFGKRIIFPFVVILMSFTSWSPMAGFASSLVASRFRKQELESACEDPLLKSKESGK